MREEKKSLYMDRVSIEERGAGTISLRILINARDMMESVSVIDIVSIYVM